MSTTRRTLIPRTRILSWVQRHRPAKTFSSTVVSDALGITDINERSSVAHALQTLERRGLVENTTPDKSRCRIYRLTPQGLALGRVEPAPRAARVPEQQADPVGAADSIFTRLGRVEASLGRLETLFARFAAELGVK